MGFFASRCWDSRLHHFSAGKYKQLLPRPTTSILRYENENVDIRDSRTLASRSRSHGHCAAGAGPLKGDPFVPRTQSSSIWGKRLDNLTRADLLGLSDMSLQQIRRRSQFASAPTIARGCIAGTPDYVKASELYLQGRSLVVRSNAEMTRAAVAAFEQALSSMTVTSARAPASRRRARLMRLRFATEQETASSGDSETKGGARARPTACRGARGSGRRLDH